MAETLWRVNMKKYFRFHRGSLSEAMKTCVEVNSLEDICKEIIKADIIGICHDSIFIEPYSNGRPDERIGWDATFMVKVRSSNGIFPIGFCNFEDTHELKLDFVRANMVANGRELVKSAMIRIEEMLDVESERVLDKGIESLNVVRVNGHILKDWHVLSPIANAYAGLPVAIIDRVARRHHILLDDFTDTLYFAGSELRTNTPTDKCSVDIVDQGIAKLRRHLAHFLIDLDDMLTKWNKDTDEASKIGGVLYTRDVVSRVDDMENGQFIEMAKTVYNDTRERMIKSTLVK